MKLNRILTIAAAVVMLLGLTIPTHPDPPEPVRIYLVGIDTAGRDGYCAFPVDVIFVSRQRTTVTILADGTKIYPFPQETLTQP